MMPQSYDYYYFKNNLKGKYFLTKYCYWYTQDEKIYMLLPYKKSEQEDLTKEQMKILKEYVKEGVL